MRIAFAFTVAVTLMTLPSAADATDDGGRAFAEHAMQAYLAMWSRDRDVNAKAVARFYAPHVVYYGKPMSREQVLADKRTYIRQWPTRDYKALPGTFTGKCEPGLDRCTITAVMTWRRVDRNERVSIGRARISLDFVPVDGTRKIARESARLL